MVLNTGTRHLILFLLFLPLLSGGLLSLPAAAEGGEADGSTLELSGPTLVDALRRGGYVIYFRHMKTDRTQTDQDRQNLSDCALQRNLSGEGRQQAKDIGAAFRILGIKVDKVMTSPYCRARDTASLAFGPATATDDLSYSIAATAEDTKKRARALRAMLSEPPMPGHNNILVAHTSNLKEAAGIWPSKEGIAIVFRPVDGDGFTPVAILDAASWTEFVAGN